MTKVSQQKNKRLTCKQNGSKQRNLSKKNRHNRKNTSAKRPFRPRQHEKSGVIQVGNGHHDADITHEQKHPLLLNRRGCRASQRDEGEEDSDIRERDDEEQGVGEYAHPLDDGARPAVSLLLKVVAVVHAAVHDAVVGDALGVVGEELAFAEMARGARC